jgi:pectate lyase
VNPTSTPPDFSLRGFATINGNTTGGQAGATVTVSNATDLNFYLTQTAPYTVRVQGTISFNSISVKSSKTIIGDGTNATLIGTLRMSGVSNVVVRNLFITNPSGVGSGDGITIDSGAHHIWVDHCTFYDCSDGELDITLASDFVTVSWCKFFYTANTGHNFVNLIGADDTNTGDRGKLRVTFHHNWWSTLCVERMPRVRFGQVHVYNNFFNSPGNNYCVRAAIESQLLIENNLFQNVKDPYVKFLTIGDPGRIKASGNSFVSTTGSADPGADTVFAPPYSLTLDAPANLSNLVTNYAGAGKVSF